jgi:hypothetical protein
MVTKVVLSAVGIVTLVGALVISPVTSAASPTVESQLPPGVVAPEECRVDPRSVDELLEAVHAAYSSALPIAESSGPLAIEASDEGISVTVAGKPWIVDGDVVIEAPGPVADDSTVASVSAVLTERVACQSAGDAPRFLALHTDAWISDSFTSAAKPGPNGEPQVPEESWELLFTSPLYEVYEVDWRPAPEIVGVWNLPDGRVAAIAITGMSQREELSSGQHGSPELVILSNVDGGWLIDYSHAISTTSASGDGA